MAEKPTSPEAPVVADDTESPHPTEPAEGAVETGIDAETARPPRPSEPAEGAADA